jgi:molybdate transport system substrate-binding protein
MAACGSGSTSGSTATTPTPTTIQGPVTLFAAASLAKVMQAEITASGNHGITGDYEGTQALLAKLQADPTIADVFISADKAHMDKAVNAGLVDGPHVMAYNSLVIAVPAGNPAHITGLADLARSGLHIALADTSVPAGAYAEKAFTAAEANHDAPAGFAKAVLANVVTRQTDVETVVAQVAAGAVDAGIVYATDAKANTHITAIAVAPAEQPAVAYYVAVVARARDHAAAQAFVTFLLSHAGQNVLSAAGFALTPPTT